MPTCKLTIINEVSCKFENLDLDTRKMLVKKFKLEDPTAKFKPAYRLGRFDGTVSFFGIGGVTYVHLIPQVLEELEKRHYHIDVEDFRISTPLHFNKIDENYWKGKTWPVGHILAGQPIIMRDYQVEAVNKFIENPQCLQELATGAGKSLITATLANLCEPFGRTILIVPNRGLVEQTEEDYINCGLDVGVYFGGRKELNKTHTICTWQSLGVLEKASSDPEAALTLAEFLDGVNCVIVDECHMAKGTVLKNLLTRNMCHAQIRWGLTGTIPKAEIDFLYLKISIGEVINQIKAHELQDQGVLSTCNVNVIQTAEFREFGSWAEELKYLVTNPDRIAYIASLINEIALTGNTLVLVDRIECGTMLAAAIPNSVFLSGSDKTKDRKVEYDEIKTADNKVIIATYGIASTGLSIVRLFNMILVESGKSFTRVIQSIGRGVRKGGDKSHVNIYDITGSTKYAKRHLRERKKYYDDAKYPYTIQKVKY